MQTGLKLVAAAALGVLALGAAHAADQTILGSALTVKNPSTADKRKVVGKAKELGSPNTIVGNPVVSGGVLTVSADGTTPSTQTILLPQGTASNGKPFWSGDAVKGFKYKNPKGEGGIPAKVVAIKKTSSGVFTIKAVLVGKFAALNVTPPNLGTSGCVLLSLTGGDTYSVKFSAGDGIISNKGAAMYQHKKVTLQGTCVTTTTTTTTSTTTSTTLYGSPSRAFVDRVAGLLD
jgi:hypothetical protein